MKCRAEHGRTQIKPVVGVIGLGIMGGGMAEALRGCPLSVMGTDNHAPRRQRFARVGIRVRSSSADVARGADALTTSLPSIAALDVVAAEIAYGCETAKSTGRRPIVIETSTLPIGDKERALAELARAGTAMLDCPISGTAHRLKERAWTML